jgi:D-alanine-D-alanine ligase
MRVILLHDEVGAGSPADELDVVSQMEAVEEALARLGHSSHRLAFSQRLDENARALRELRPDIVFNLVESLGGSGRLIHIAPSLLDSMAIPYTGCPTDAVYATSNKLMGKRLMRGAGIRTPRHFAARELHDSVAVPGGRYIIKSVWEHASRGLDESSVIQADTSAQLRAALERRASDLGGEGFAEAYIEGREFNLSVLDGHQGPQVLPPAEILFEGYAADRPRVVGYRAKWDEGSYEYHHTPRRFEFAESDEALLTGLRETSLRCWDVFGLRGCARVDFRIDERGTPWVLEINTNPCLSRDAGFAAALERGGVAYADAIDRILTATLGNRDQAPQESRRLQAKPPLPTFRDEPRPSDAAAIREIVASTGFFHDFEVDVAVELIDERLARGLASEYFFLFADDPVTGQPLGYGCFGPIACTRGSYDLYWIAVHDSQRGRGLGRAILQEAERRIAAGLPNPIKPDEMVRGRRVYIETSSKPAYAPTRAFYTRCGYSEEARFADFYAAGDDKLVYFKALD